MCGQHIISTHVEDVSLDFTGDTPRGEQNFSAHCAAIDNKVLTQILDADHRVQMALKAWEKVEMEMGDKFAEDSPKVQSMTIGESMDLGSPIGLQVSSAGLFPNSSLNG